MIRLCPAQIGPEGVTVQLQKVALCLFFCLSCPLAGRAHLLFARTRSKPDAQLPFRVKSGKGSGRKADKGHSAHHDDHDGRLFAIWVSSRRQEMGHDTTVHDQVLTPDVVAECSLASRDTSSNRPSSIPTSVPPRSSRHRRPPRSGNGAPFLSQTCARRTGTRRLQNEKNDKCPESNIH